NGGAPARAVPGAIADSAAAPAAVIAPRTRCAPPPQPNPGLPGFGHFKACRKRASPQPAGEGWGPSAHHRTTPTRLASLATLPTRGAIYLTERIFHGTLRNIGDYHDLRPD